MAAVLFILVFSISLAGFACLAISQRSHRWLLPTALTRHPAQLYGIRLTGAVLLAFSLAVAIIRDGLGLGIALWTLTITLSAFAVAVLLECLNVARKRSAKG